MTGSPVEKPRGFRGIFRTDDDARAVYSETAGIQRILPLAVAVPVDVEDLSTLVVWAGREGAALIPRGSGSSMAGAAIGPGVIVDLSRWRTIEGIDAGARRVSVGPGAICGDVDKLANAEGLRFPVQPSSAPFASIGGMTATNAAGASTFAYGQMRAWVEDIECLFADGTNVTPSPHVIPSEARDPLFARDTVGRVLKNSSGYFTGGSLKDLLVGSEGTLAFFTRIHLRLQGVPRFANTVLGVFDSLEGAAVAAVNARESGAATCELLDRTYLDFVEADTSGSHRLRIDRSDPRASRVQAILIADVEADLETELDAMTHRVAEGFTKEGFMPATVAREADHRNAMWLMRHAASPIIATMSETLKSMQFVEDGCVPPERLSEYVTGVRAALARQRITGVIFGHAGDAHVHVNPMVDITLPDWRRRVEELFDEVTALVASLGGSISGEHGDGRIRTPMLERVWGPDRLAEFARIKEAFDPRGILNPGVKVPMMGQDGAIGDIKHDPSLPPLPRRASEALKDVVRGRGYSRFRLEMLG